MEKISTKKVSIFAPFWNKDNMDMIIEDLTNKLPKKYRSELHILLGCFEQTILHGYREKNKGENG